MKRIIFKHIQQNQKGLTLVEVLAAMAILSIIVVAFLNISGYMTLAFSRSNEETEALRLAEKILSEKRTAIDNAATRPTENTQNVPTYDQNGYKVTIFETDVTRTTPYTLPAKTRHVSVQAVVLLKEATTSNLKQRLLTVTVSWGGSTP